SFSMVQTFTTLRRMPSRRTRRENRLSTGALIAAVLASGVALTALREQTPSRSRVAIAPLPAGTRGGELDVSAAAIVVIGTATTNLASRPEATHIGGRRSHAGTRSPIGA